MNVGQAKQTARDWVTTSLRSWTGLRAAHLVGGITSMPNHAPWPSHKDVDMHLIFAEGSAALEPAGPFQNILEIPHAGLLIEAGLKSAREYRSPEMVLANPEIAHHLTVDSLLYDPSGLLAELQGAVRAHYPRRQWVRARLDYERVGLAGAMAMRQMVRAMTASGEAMILGYTTTFIAAALCVATLTAPTTGSRASLRVRDIVTAHGRPDLYQAFLASLGLTRTSPRAVADFLIEGEAAFDRAVTLRRTPHPFQHKLHPHLKPYFVESCRSLLREDYHREALHWLTPFYHASTDVLLTDGPEAEQPAVAARHSRFMAALGLDTAEQRESKFEQMQRVHEQVFALADGIIEHDPAIAA